MAVPGKHSPWQWGPLHELGVHNCRIKVEHTLLIHSRSWDAPHRIALSEAPPLSVCCAPRLLSSAEASRLLRQFGRLNRLSQHLVRYEMKHCARKYGYPGPF